MTNIDITPILQAVIVLISAVVTIIIIPWIKTKISTSQYELLQEMAKIAVNAAEVIFKGTKLGKDKLEYVTNYLNSICNEKSWKYDSDSIRQAIENAWKEMTGK